MINVHKQAKNERKFNEFNANMKQVCYICHINVVDVNKIIWLNSVIILTLHPIR